ncbi:MAG TPA: hypothetical protein VNM92_13085 [Thermoanaerobaculia bacterium]|nr:hypothetical protein [Thermoanaerobaculia bacterium]
MKLCDFISILAEQTAFREKIGRAPELAARDFHHGNDPLPLIFARDFDCAERADGKLAWILIFDTLHSVVDWHIDWKDPVTVSATNSLLAKTV